jgi:hypothetical protein
MTTISALKELLEMSEKLLKESVDDPEEILNNFAFNAEEYKKALEDAISRCTS